MGLKKVDLLKNFSSSCVVSRRFFISLTPLKALPSHTKKTKAILCWKSRHGDLEEMQGLIESADIELSGLLRNPKSTSDPRFYLGPGKIKELQKLIQDKKTSLVIFNHTLSGVQSRNLANILKCSLLERRQLILRIFTLRAQSYEGRLQAELAQKLDELPRMRGAWLGSLSRQAGGRSAQKKGGRGPGEKALETDRRQIQKQILSLRKKIKNVRKSRSTARARRQKNEAVSFALIGYTHAGKSSLMSRLCKTKTAVSGGLFSTLDPRTKKVFVPGLKNCILTDTVGFIQNLPPHLISAFKATLEESSFADILLHVIDVSSPKMREQIRVVRQLVHELGWGKKPIIHVYNKLDLISLAPELEKTSFRALISARSGQGTHHLLEQMKQAYFSLNKKVDLFFPAGEEHKIEHLRLSSDIHDTQKSAGGTLCRAGMRLGQAAQWKPFIIES